MARKQWLSVGDLTHEGFVNKDGVTCYTTNASGHITKCSYTSAPSAVAGYAVGCELTNSTTGEKYVNTGSVTSCTFTSMAVVGLTATATELNYLDIAVLGTGAASKAVVLDAGDDYTWPATGVLTYGVLKDSAGTTITATGAEINYLDIAVLGTGAASKAVVLDTGDDYTWPATGVLTYGVLKDSAGTTITATGAEINYLDIAVLGTGAASKAVVLDAGDDYTWPATGVLTYGVLKDSAGTTITATGAEINYLDITTAGTTEASKAVVLDAAESLTWATTDATASETCTLTITDTRTGPGATGWAAKFALESNVALGAYANGAYGYLAFGAAGRITGLAAGVCSETVLSAGCTQGTYAGLEIELGMPTGAVCGTRASLIYCSLYGDDASTFDTNGYFFEITGVTKDTNKVYAATTSGSTARPTEVLRVYTPDGVRYLPLYSTVACAA